MNSASAVYHARRLDWWMLAAVGALTLLGVLFVYSASYRGEGIPVAAFYRKQMVWAAVGAACLVALALLDYHRLAGASWLIYAAGIVGLLLVLLVGDSIHGATRWLSLFGVRVQPSEFAKIATLLALARFLSLPGTDPRRPIVVVQAGLIALIPFLLVFQEPDLGTAAVFVPLTLVLLYIAGVPMKTLCFLALLALLFLPVGWLRLEAYQKRRVLAFFDAGRDPLGDGWNMIQSQIAVGSGGLTGKGYLEGTQNVLGFLPANVAPTDFIYSVIAEELGFAGSLLVLLLYAAVLIGAIRAALVSKDKLGRLLAAGVATILFSHVFVNIAMTIGLMPITGLPLPLVSYGGSFMVSTMCGLGIIQSVYVRRMRR